MKDDYDYSMTPSSCFSRKPVYSVYDYSAVVNGDIVWETDTKFKTGHNALIVDTEHGSSYGNYIQTIEAVLGGVQRGFLDDYRMSYYKCYILRVKGRTDSNADRASRFAAKQLGKPYDVNTMRLNTAIDSTCWYCSELVYAAWKYAGIDIGVKNGSYLQWGCLPSDINNSDNTYLLPNSVAGFLELYIAGKEGSTWKIRIHNKTGKELEVLYNEKMSLLEDSKNWNDMKNKREITIPSYASKVVEIKENWLCTSISACYVVDDYRFITYADSLNKNDYSLKSYHNIVLS